MVSIVTPTVRPEGLALVAKALRRQTYKNYTWHIVTSQAQVLVDKYVGRVAYSYVQEPPLQDGDIWNLNHAYNTVLRTLPRNSLVVSWQDWTYATPDALEKFVFHFQNEPKTLVTGVGNKYEDDTWMVQTWKDPRQRDDQGTFYPCFFNDIEFNFCSVPIEAFYAVGGFDEYLDKFYGMDGYSVVARLQMIGGWDFKIDQTNISYSLEHGRLPDWEERNALHGPYAKREKDYLEHPTLPYLQTK